MIFRILKNQKYMSILNSPLRYKDCIALSLMFVLVFSIGTAWSYESHQVLKNYDVSRETLYNSVPYPSVKDVCYSLLETKYKNSPRSVTARNQRTAGKVAALGIILGVRFALEPKNDNSVASLQSSALRHQNEANSHRSAQAIAAYRLCQKERTLNKVALMH